MDNSKAPNGTYTPIPNVFFDTCDLPETAQILYLRLYRHVHYRGCQFTGSIRVLAKLVRLSKSTTDRMVKRLEQSGLITVEREPGQTNMQVMTITIMKDELWELNKQHEIEPVPNWDTTLPDCPNLGQSVPPEGQAVPDRDELSQAQAQKGTVINTNKPKQKEKEIMPPPSLEIENQEQEPPQREELSFSFKADITRTANTFGEAHLSKALREETTQLYNEVREHIDMAMFRIKYDAAKEEVNRATLEQIQQLGFLDKSSYLLHCLRKKCKLSHNAISVPA